MKGAGPSIWEERKVISPFQGILQNDLLVPNHQVSQFCSFSMLVSLSPEWYIKTISFFISFLTVILFPHFHTLTGQLLRLLLKTPIWKYTGWKLLLCLDSFTIRGSFSDASSPSCNVISRVLTRAAFK